ncbi:MAG: tRNA (adenosine(37)-N6)-dimethylallyltransferase MiaA [Crocinitomicaceae bacterium]|nr:tRNA (adenosine(37)-N6)-dimethylallyltransferase MiaA [Crocinitomicaceae bacterium]
MPKTDLLVILGPTASGKTKLAVAMAQQLNGEIISADSRQIYKGMDIGTGKDLEEYGSIPYHLIDNEEPGVRYNIKQYRQDFDRVYKDITSRGKYPILCGGSGLYIQAALSKMEYSFVPTNEDFRRELDHQSEEELKKQFQLLDRTFLEKFDSSSVKRIKRALEIHTYLKQNPLYQFPENDIQFKIYGIEVSREDRRKKIEQRLNTRLENGLIEEVIALRKKGISDEDLIYYGLEYKWVTLYLNGELDLDTMRKRLLVAIQQFAKRQMTFFRSMEKKDFKIEWGTYEDLLHRIPSSLS